MNASHFENVARALSDSEGTRRGFGVGLASVLMAAGMSHLAIDDADAKKRKKKGKIKKRKKKGNGGNDGGGGGCNQTICEGQCVNLDTDENNCGACGAACPEGSACAAGFCVFATGRQGDGFEEFDEPTGIAAGANGLLVVADTNHDRVQVLETDIFLGSFGGFGEGNGQFLRPIGVTGNPKTGDIYVTDGDLHRVQKFDTAGTFRATTGSFGTGERSFNAPLGLAVDRVTESPATAKTSFSSTPLAPPAAATASSASRPAWSSTASATWSSPTAATTASRSSIRRGDSCAPSAARGTAPASSTARWRWRSIQRATSLSSIRGTTAYRSSRKMGSS
jgi:hypothetical protein